MELQIIQSKIHEIRGRRVMLDFDLAALYEVETRVLKQSVRRNFERFDGDDFMFELSEFEIANLRSQFVTSSWGGTRYAPFAFTEMGVAMLSSVLRSNKAIEINRGIMRAFVAIREYLTGSALQFAELAELRERIKALEHGAEETLGSVNDLSEDMRREIDDIYLAIGELSIKPKSAARRPIGYKLPHTTQD